MKRLPAAAALVVTALVLLAAPSIAQSDDTDADADPTRIISVIEVSGLIDPVVANYIEQQLADAEDAASVAIVLQVNSPGHVVSDERMRDLLARLDASSVPVGVWVGQAGGEAFGGAAHFVTVADLSGISPRSDIGEFAELGGVEITPPLDQVANGSVSDIAAVEAGIVDVRAPTVGEFILALEDGSIIDVVSEQFEQDDGLILRGLAADVQVRFASLSLVDQLFHTAASPAVAYLLLLIGLAMILLDFFTGGVGVAGVVGTVCLLLSAYGLHVLRTNNWAIVLLVVSVIAFGVDLQAGSPRFWTMVGVITLVVGSFRLYDGHSTGWLPLTAGIGLTVAFMFSGMPALIRTRYGTSTIGREWMIGEMGVAVTDIAPDGIVRIRDAQWRARANRLTPIEAGEPARVVSLEGLLLEVEPEEGGAIDYREMRRSRDGDEADGDGSVADPAISDSDG